MRDERFTDAVEHIRNSLFHRWVISKDPVEREEIHRSYKNLDRLMNSLIVIMDDGKMKQHELEAIQAGRSGLSRVA